MSNDAPTTFPIGTTVVTWTIIDSNGNVTTCTQDVTVIDNNPPIIQCLPPLTVGTDNDSCEATEVDLGEPLAGDVCGSVTLTSDAPEAFPLGTTIVTWTATDDAGNTATCQQQVTVTDDDDPVVVSCAADITISADDGLCGSANAELGVPDVSDNCGIATVTNNAPETFPVGTTVVIWTITDVNGNSVTCIQTVTVTDDEPPVVDCPDDIVVTAERGEDSAVVHYPAPTASDNCGLASLVSSPASGSDFPIGVTVVTATATDIHGNTASCTFTITVNEFGNEPPVANPDDYSVLNGTLTVPAPGVMENDSDPDGDSITADLVSGPTSGTVTLNPDGSFVYNAFGSFQGTDSFTYRVNDGLLDSNVTTVTLQLLVEVLVDDNELFAKTAKAKLSWLKPNADAFLVKGQVNPNGANANLAGATLQVLVNGQPLTPPIVLDAKGKGISVSGLSIAKTKFSPKRGKYSFKISKADLKDELGLPNITQNGLTNLDIQLKILGAGLDIDELEGVFETPFKTALNKATQARFAFSKHRTLTGVFNANKTLVAQLADGTFKVSTVGVIEGDGGTPIIISGPVILHIGDASTTVPATLVKFAITNSKHRFLFKFSTLAGTGVPLAGPAAPTLHDLPVTLEVPTVDGTFFFDSLIEIKRTVPTGLKWKR